MVRVPTESGKSGKQKWSWKSHGTWKIGQKSWNFVISHGILPILPPNLTKCVCLLSPLGNRAESRKSAFSNVFRKMSRMQNWEERWSWKIKKWSWKSHGKIICQVCGNPDGAFHHSISIGTTPLYTWLLRTSFQLSGRLSYLNNSGHECLSLSLFLCTHSLIFSHSYSPLIPVWHFSRCILIHPVMAVTQVV